MIVSDKIFGEERTQKEDELVGLAYEMVNVDEVTPEEFETARDDKRLKKGLLMGEGDLKTWLRKTLEENLPKLQKAENKAEMVEILGDILEIVETYTARF